jgi:hypothetical protein
MNKSVEQLVPDELGLAAIYVACSERALAAARALTLPATVTARGPALRLPR